MDNLNMILIDCNDYFLASNNKCNVKIDYKLYSMMAGSIDYQKTKEVFNSASFQEIIEHIAFLRYKIEDLKRRSVHGKVQDKCYSEFYHDISLLYEPVCSLVDTGHLNKQQLSLVMELFMHEFTMHFKSEYFNLNNAKTYTPSILINSELKNYINSLLLNNKLDNLSLLKIKKELEHTQIKMTFTTFDDISSTTLDDIPSTIFDNTSRPVYNIRNTLDFLLVDLHKSLSDKKNIKKCLCCERLFFSSYGAKYCRLSNKDTNKTCDYIMHHKQKDELESFFNNAKRLQARKRDNEKNVEKYGYEFMRCIYDTWLKECKRQYENARYNNDIEGFKSWIEKNKFLKERLPSLYEEYKNKTDKNVENE